jgi:hypothetical protein
MHTMVVRMSIDPSRADEVARHFRYDIVGWAKRQPVSSPANGCAAPTGGRVWAWSSSPLGKPLPPLRRARATTPATNDRAWNIDSVTVYEQLTSA